MTLIEKLKKGKMPEILMKVAKNEDINLEKLAQDMLAGYTVVPANNKRSLNKPVAIGKDLRVKVNANIGTSEDYPSLDDELKKLRVALLAGADTMMDLSTGGNLDAVRRRMIEKCSVPLGTVPIYQAAIEAKETYGSTVKMTPEQIFEVIERQAQDGVDFMTIHAGVTLRALETLKKKKRVTEVVSRGAAFLIGWMIHQNQENPLYTQFDRLLEILREHGVTISLGDGMRPGCLADATDATQLEELATLGQLAREARGLSVQVMIEGPGHVPFDQIEANVKLEKLLCDGAPFYVLGPLVTDIAPGYDHITAAIGGTMAAFAGADFLCYVTPREHLGLPTEEDVREGTIVARIAAHAADVAKGLPQAKEWDLKMAKARKALNWQEQVKFSIDGEKTRKAYETRKGTYQNACTMCGEFCAMKLVSDYLGSERPNECF